jgi:hypothetical protein
MKISFKPAIDNSEQLNLRISPMLKQRIEKLRTHTKKLGLDLNATLTAHIEEFVNDSEKQLGIRYEPDSKTVANQPVSNGADRDRA